MRQSYFNFFVAIFCGLFAVFGNQDSWAVSINVILSLLNLAVGVVLYKQEQHRGT